MAGPSIHSPCQLRPTTHPPAQATVNSASTSPPAIPLPRSPTHPPPNQPINPQTRTCPYSAFCRYSPGPAPALASALTGRRAAAATAATLFSSTKSRAALVSAPPPPLDASDELRLGCWYWYCWYCCCWCWRAVLGVSDLRDDECWMMRSSCCCVFCSALRRDCSLTACMLWREWLVGVMPARRCASLMPRTGLRMLSTCVCVVMIACDVVAQMLWRRDNRWAHSTWPRANYLTGRVSQSQHCTGQRLTEQTASSCCCCFGILLRHRASTRRVSTSLSPCPHLGAVLVHAPGCCCWWG